jgi:hypothetical protein
MTKYKKTKRKIQKGGLFDSQSWSNWSSGLWNKTKEKVSSGTTSIETGLEGISENASSSVSSLGTSMSEGISKSLSDLNPFSSDSSSSYSSTFNSSPPITGGKRKNKYSSKRHRKTIKGGKGGLGLTYYATPVSGIRVAEPTTWQFYENGVNQYSIKGGSKKRRSYRRKQNKKKTRRYKKY